MHSVPQKGFTLIEVLIYIAVVIFVAGAAILTFFSLQDTFERNRIERELSSAASNVLERMVREMHGAERVNTGLSLFDTSPGELALVHGATTTRFYVATDTVMVSENGVAVGPLVPRNVTVESLKFWRYTNAYTEAARIELKLSVNSRFASTTKTFYAFGVLRGSYE